MMWNVSCSNTVWYKLSSGRDPRTPKILHEIRIQSDSSVKGWAAICSLPDVFQHQAQSVHLYHTLEQNISTAYKLVTGEKLLPVFLPPLSSCAVVRSSFSSWNLLINDQGQPNTIPLPPTSNHTRCLIMSQFHEYIYTLKGVYPWFKYGHPET